MDEADYHEPTKKSSEKLGIPASNVSFCMILVASHRSASFQTKKHALKLYLFIIELLMRERWLRQSERYNITSVSTVPTKISSTGGATDVKTSFPVTITTLLHPRHQLHLNEFM